MMTYRVLASACAIAGVLGVGCAAGVGDAPKSYFEAPLRAHGAATGDLFGQSLAAADFDGDRHPELVVGAPTNGTGSGSVSIYSGADGAQVEWLGGTMEPGAGFGTALATGDLTGDGIPDLAVSAPHTRNGLMANVGSVFIYSGRNGRLARRIQGWSEAMQFGDDIAVADLDADGRLDLVVGASIYRHRGRLGAIFVFSGKTWNMVREIQGAEGKQVGARVVTGDVDGDTVPEIIAGAAGETGHGEVQVFSSADGHLLRRITGGKSHWYGTGLAAADLNRDGAAEVIVGDPYGSGAGGGTYSGAIFAYAGKDGSLLHRWSGSESNCWFGGQVATGDLDGDHVPDVFAAAPASNESRGSILVFSGRTGEQLTRLDHEPDGRPSSGGLGTAMYPVDVDGDKHLDLLTSAPSLVNRSGVALLYFGKVQEPSASDAAAK